jgi:hypothetical protein
MPQVFPGTPPDRIHRGRVGALPAGAPSVFLRIHLGRLRLGPEVKQAGWTAEGTQNVWFADDQCKILKRY